MLCLCQCLNVTSNDISQICGTRPEVFLGVLTSKNTQYTKNKITENTTKNKNTNTTLVHISTTNISALDAIITTSFHSAATNSIVDAVACGEPFDQSFSILLQLHLLLQLQNKTQILMKYHSYVTIYCTNY